MKYSINGMKKLSGGINVCSAKNCVLALMAASVLTEDDVVIRRCEKITDVENMAAILKSLGCKVVWSNCDLLINCGNLKSSSLPEELSGLLRGSVFLLGALIGRTGKASMGFPGGCAIGSRPIDIHLSGFERLGVKVDTQDGQIVCDASCLKGNDVYLRFASVGATENLIMASVLAEGTTVLYNCATEPEVEALEKFLRSMGADIRGIGTSTLTIRGVKKLHGTAFYPISDRIVAATYITACLTAGGDITVCGCNPRHMTSFLDVIKDRCELLTPYSDAIHVRSKERPKDYGRIFTMPYPGFPTDMQSLLMSAAAVSDGGRTTITENLFENRLLHNAAELCKMGADIKVAGNVASIVGVKKLRATPVSAGDLRGGAGLILAALAADGNTVVSSVEHVYRGYMNLDEDLRLLGADVVKII